MEGIARGIKHICFFALLVCLAQTAGAVSIFWTDGIGIHRMDLESKERKTLLSSDLSSPGDIALDLERGKIYWTDARTSKIQRSNLDGSGVETIISGLMCPEGIDVDLVGEKIYWVEIGGKRRGIWRSDLNGANVEAVIRSPAFGPRDIVVDGLKRKIYRTETFRAEIIRMNFDGENEKVIVVGEHAPFEGVPIAIAGGKIYWAYKTCISRSDPDGNDVEQLITDVKGGVKGIAVDEPNGRIYWTEYEPHSEIGRVRCADLEGANEKTLILIRSRTPSGIAVDPVKGRIYWIESASTPFATTGMIRWADLDGADPKDLIKPKLRTPSGIALDMIRRKVYWTDLGTKKIQRANFDGTDVEDVIVTGLNLPIALSIDENGDKIYWADWGDGIIARANLDGTNVERIFETLKDKINRPRDIDFDPIGGRIYWANAKQVLSIDPNDGNLRGHASGFHIGGIFVDGERGRIYWTDNGFMWKVQSADLEGGDLKEIYVYPKDLASAGGDYLRDIAVDTIGDRVYWIDAGWGYIRRDGGPIVGNLVSLQFIALDLSSYISIKPRGRKPVLWGALRRNLLLQNFPNPFNSETWIPFRLAQEGEVKIQIFDMRGQTIRLIDLGKLPAGNYEKTAYWDGRNDEGEPVSSGVYLYQIRVGDFQTTRRMIILR
jgi:DNA-binding beta-propeller fold protein YncE